MAAIKLSQNATIKSRTYCTTCWACVKMLHTRGHCMQDFLRMLSKFFFLRMLSNFLLLRFVMVWLQPYFPDQRVSVSDLFRMLIVAHTSMLNIWSLYVCSYFHAIATLFGISQVVVHFLVHFGDRFELLLCVLVNLFSSRISLFKQFYVWNFIITWYW